MQLTRHTDYALRVLLYVGQKNGQISSIREISEAYGISHNHLMKVVHELGKAGYLSSVRGRYGGVKLARPAQEINIGEVVRSMESDFELAACSSCKIGGGCGLQSVLAEALTAFLAVFCRYSLQDLLVLSPKIEIMLLSLSENSKAD
jgi:Rrf2 family transcriptional regulator, nitric oxide-sensitive transcriptional repressor